MPSTRPIPHERLYLSPATGYWHIGDVRRQTVEGPFALCSLPLREEERYAANVPEAGGVSPFAVCQDCLKLWNALPEPPRIEEPKKGSGIFAQLGDMIDRDRISRVEALDRTELLCEIADMLKPGLSAQSVERAKALGLLVIALELGLLRDAVEKTSNDG